MEGFDWFGVGVAGCWIGKVDAVGGDKGGEGEGGEGVFGTLWTLCGKFSGGLCAGGTV